MPSRVRLQNALFLLLVLGILIFAFYPGRFDGDSISQLDQGKAFQFTDNWSPIMSLALGVLSDVMPGPAPMFCLQLVILFVGLFSLRT